MAAIGALLFVAGAVAGSFVSVVAHRLPRGESIVSPRSRCPRCAVRIAAYDNVPVVSWLLLRGRCRHCGTSIPVRYLGVEIAVGALFVTTFLAIRDDPVQLALGVVLVAVLAAITLTDLERRVIPNRILLVAAMLGVAIAAAADPASLPERTIAAIAAGGLLLLAALAYPGGMGMGDVKLAAVMGIYLGAAVAPALVAAFAAGSLVGVAMMLRHGAAARKRALPFGPFLALGAVVGLWLGDELVHWYLDAFLGG